MTTEPRHPIQPLVWDDKVLRFKKNAIVEYLLDKGGLDMNALAVVAFSREDREQFAQLIGYSLSGFGELSYHSPEVYFAAEKMFDEGKSEHEARADALREKLIDVQTKMRDGAAILFGIHPDDLNIEPA